MIGQDFANVIGEGIIKLVVISFAAGVALTLVTVFGLPWLWELIRPWLHGVTA
jgi:hypothetical protein